MAADGRCVWPREAYIAGNAGVMLVGRSAKHGDVPAVLLGGRFYTGKRTYAYTDFGGGVDRKKGETPQQGAFREFAEELFGQDEEQAKVTANKLCTATASALVGNRPFVHKSAYVMFIVPAEVVAAAMQLPATADGGSAIDHMFAIADRNAELTSVALVSIQELIRGAFCDGKVYALSIRQLDGQEQSSKDIWLRQVMVGGRGSVCTIRDALETFVNRGDVEMSREREERKVIPAVGGLALGAAEPGTSADAEAKKGSTITAQQVPDLQSSQAEGGDEISSALGASAPKKSRWRRPAAESREEGTLEAKPPASAPPQAAVPSREPRHGKKLMPYVFDMETGDPDDVLTLLFLASHPAVELRAVTITPGSKEQVALVRWLLQQLGLTHVRLGGQGWPANSQKPVQLTTDFYRSFGRSNSGDPECERADTVLLECCDESVTLVTGAPLHNLGDALKMDGFQLGRWVAQGGFAGEGVVPRAKQMDKFMGKATCSTWNFGGIIPAAKAALASTAIARKICVSKNVCHAVYYDHEWHEALGAAARAVAKDAPEGRRAAALGMMYTTMDRYLRNKPGGKKLHDPLALSVALDESVCDLEEVELFCQKGQWGSRLSPGSSTWISVAYNASKFQAALLA